MSRLQTQSSALRHAAVPAQLPENVQDLQQLARDQSAEIRKLKGRLALFLRAHTEEETPKDTRGILEDVERDTESLNQSLLSQLGKARQTKQALESGELIQNSEAIRVPDIPKTDDPAQLRYALEECVQLAQDQRTLIKKLQFELDMEQGHVNILRHDNQKLRQLTVDLQASAEQEEEYISNTLLKRITNLKKEKGQLIQQVEQEEEYLTNTLQRKLEKLQKEKIDLENALEREQEFVVNKLQKQLDALRLQQSSVRDHGSGSTSATSVASPIGSPTARHHRRPSHTDYLSTQQAVVEMLKAEVNGARIKISELEKDLMSVYNQAGVYRKELIELRKRAGLPIEDLVNDECVYSHRYSFGSRQRSPSASSARADTSSSSLDIPRRQQASSKSGHGVFDQRYSQSVPNLGQAMPPTRTVSSSSISKRKSTGYDRH